MHPLLSRAPPVPGGRKGASLAALDGAARAFGALRCERERENRNRETALSVLRRNLQG